ncbi:MAG TPA: LEA type 2 family protein [Cytophagaceae bacterium]|jgi:LEA14-like dessication related protein|nr:LEA type 2 family protein [Cytophagaceae bacterium]
MKNISKFLLFLIVSLLLSLTSCFSYKELELGDVSDVKVNKVANGGIEIQAGIRIKNPNNYKIKVKKIDADLFVNGQKVGKMNLSKKVILPRKSDQVQSFVVNTQLSNLIASMPSLLFGGDINLQMKGYIKGKVFIFSKKFPIEAEKKISTQDFNLF